MGTGARLIGLAVAVLALALGALAIAVPSGVELWSLDVGGALRSTPVLGAGRVLTTCTVDGAAIGIDADTGRVLWRAILPGGVADPAVATADKRFFVYVTNASVVCLGASDGATQWTWTAPARCRPTAAAALVSGSVSGLDADEVVIVPTACGAVALATPSLRLVWQYPATLAAAAAASAPSVPAAGVTVARDALSGLTLALVPFWDGTLRAISCRDGAVVWSFHGVSDAPGPAVTVDEHAAVVYAAQWTDVFAVSLTRGELIWHFACTPRPCGGSITAPPTLLKADTSSTVLAGAYNGKVYALDARTGRQLWYLPTGGTILRSQPTLVASALAPNRTSTLFAVGQAAGELVVADLSGNVSWTFATASAIDSSPLVDASTGLVFVASEDNSLYCIAPPTSLATNPTAPQQLLMAVGTRPDARVVTYVTQPAHIEFPTTVVWGPTPASMWHTALGSSVVFTDGPSNYSSRVHTVELTGLELGARAFYSCGSDASGWSPPTPFTVPPLRRGADSADGGGASAVAWAVFGDFGNVNGASLPALISDVANGVIQGVVHVGDFAYDLDTAQGATGDAFLNALQPVGGRVPYMTCAGNHESANNFSHYEHRFAGVAAGAGAASGSGTNRWYSFDVAGDLIHWVAVDTELMESPPATMAAQWQRQLQWLRRDLAAVNRTRTPWVVMFGHKAGYMDNVNFTAIEDLAVAYGVDVYVCGHQHNYERFLPMERGAVSRQDDATYVDPPFMTTIVVGSPGCSEHVEVDFGPFAQAAVRTSVDYGYGRLSALNATHLEWTWLRSAIGTVDGVGRASWGQGMRVEDSLLIVRSSPPS